MVLIYKQNLIKKSKKAITLQYFSFDKVITC